MMTRTGAMLVAAGLAMGVAWPAAGQDREPDPDRIERVQPDEDARAQPEEGGVDLPGRRGAGGGENTVTIGPFSEPVELQLLTEMAVDMLEVNIAIDPSLSGQVSLPHRIEIPRDELLPLLDSLLNQNGFSIYYDETTRFYNVVPTDNLPLEFAGPLPTTRVIRTPNVRPSALSDAIDEQLGNAKPRITYQDELGMMIATGPRERLDLLERLVELMLAERRQQSLTRIELEYISSPSARQRLIDLLGAANALSPLTAGGAAGQARNVARGAQQDPAAAGQGAAAGTGLENIADRLGVDPKGNALLFRGRPDEIEEVRALVELIDVPDELQEKRFQTGTATEDIAQQAEYRGLGEVVMMSGGGAGAGVTGQQGRGGQRGRTTPAGLAGQFDTGVASVGGSRIVANPIEGYIMYYGTERQQEIMKRLVATFELDQDRIVAQTYKLYHADATEVADIVFALVSEQAQTGTSPLLPGQTGRNQQQQQDQPPPAQTDAQEGEELGVGIQPGVDVFVTPDPANNQVAVRAPARLQDEVERLIRKLDLRRPQVFIDIRIVSATMDDSIRVAFETQLVNASGTGGALQTNFGLTNAGDAFTDPRTVATGLAGLTSAVIKSEYVPIVVNALQTQVDARIVSAPKLLVDDNEEATIESVDQEPITSINQGQNTDTVTFDGFQDAGTQVTVTPSISDEGYIRLNYEISLSNFTGDSTGQGIPPPRQDRAVTSESVTIPTDTTIVVGGIDIMDESKQVRKVPILGDIPLVGHLFRDQSDRNDRTVLYVFITPKILRESNFSDLRLLTEGPLQQMKVKDDIPKMKPITIPIRDTPINRTSPGEVSERGNTSGRG